MALEQILHIIPHGDLIEHEPTGEGCVCGPDTEWLISASGGSGKLIVHHALDGRELVENSRTGDPGE